MGRKTGNVAQNMHGEKLYQQRARQALPILVRQAYSGNPLYYEQLADELGMPNPRNLNFVLGSVGQTLLELGRRWKEDIPPIQCLVINQRDELPGEGFGWFVSDKADWEKLSKRQKKNLVTSVVQRIHAYPRWDDVLIESGLKHARIDITDLMRKASAFHPTGESQSHRALKEYILNTPSIVQVSDRYGPGKPEHEIPSGDRIDVFFDAGKEWVGVEVKSSLSSEADIVRGIFQCVKYSAVLNAVLSYEQIDIHARAVLVLEGGLPHSCITLKNALGVKVFERVTPHNQR